MPEMLGVDCSLGSPVLAHKGPTKLSDLLLVEVPSMRRQPGCDELVGGILVAGGELGECLRLKLRHLALTRGTLGQILQIRMGKSRAHGELIKKMSPRSPNL